MTRCSTGRATQKYSSSGGGADLSSVLTAQGDILYADSNTEAANVSIGSTTGHVLTITSPGELGWQAVSGAAGSVGTLQAVTTAGPTTDKTIQFHNTTTSLSASGNVLVTGNVTAQKFYGDGSNLIGIAPVSAASKWTSINANDISYSTGNVAIGGVAAGYDLDVDGDINFTGNIRKNGVIQALSGGGGGGGGGQWAIVNTNDISFTIGNVGIATTTPGYDLDVNGDINFTGAILKNGVPQTLGGVAGPAGPAGPAGVQGPIGPSGGEQGVQGIQGIRGDTGRPSSTLWTSNLSVSPSDITQLAFDDQQPSTVFTGTLGGNFNGVAIRDTTNQYIRLTQGGTNRIGTVYWELIAGSNWTVTFEMYILPITAGGADDMRFIFFAPTAPATTDNPLISNGGHGGHYIRYEYFEGDRVEIRDAANTVLKTAETTLQMSGWMPVTVTYIDGVLTSVIKNSSGVVLNTTIHDFGATLNSHHDVARYFGFSGRSSSEQAEDRIRNINIVTIDITHISYTSGNVGIGTGVPVYDLDVTGDINFTGDIRKNGVIETLLSTILQAPGDIVYADSTSSPVNLPIGSTTGHVLTITNQATGQLGWQAASASGGAVGNLQNVTANGPTTDITIEFTNSVTSLIASGNVLVTGNVTAQTYYGDGTNLNGVALATHLVDNALRITNLTLSNTHIWSNLASNVGRIEALETSNVGIWSNLASNVDRIEALETNGIISNSSSITSVTQGDLIYASGDSTLQTLALGGTVGHVLKVSTNGIPEWAAETGGSGGSGSGTSPADVTRITNLEYSNTAIWSNLASNVVRIEALEDNIITGSSGSIGSFSTGDIIYANGVNSLQKLPIGSSSQGLSVSTAGLPEWVDTIFSADGTKVYYTDGPVGIANVSPLSTQTLQIGANVSVNDTLSDKLIVNGNVYVSRALRAIDMVETYEVVANFFTVKNINVRSPRPRQGGVIS